MGEIVKITDSHLYKIEMVVAMTSFTSGFGAEKTATALDFVLDVLSGDHDLLVLDSKETRLELRTISDDDSESKCADCYEESDTWAEEAPSFRLCADCADVRAKEIDE